MKNKNFIKNRYSVFFKAIFKLLNRIKLFIYCWIAFKTNTSPKRPFTVIIGITNACNLNCSFCFQTLKKEKTIKFMSFDLFKKILSQIKNWNNHIEFSLFGEPTLHKDFLIFIKHAKEQGFYVSVFTNGTMLNNMFIKNLINIAPDAITISIDAILDINNSHYNTKQKSLTNNIKDLIRYRNNTSSKKPYIMIRTIELSNKSSDIKKQIKAINADKIISVPLDNWSGHLISDSKECSISHYTTHCLFPWFFLSIDWNGDVTMCCDDFSLKNKMGNVNHTSLKMIWKSKKVKQFRSILFSRNKNEIANKTGCSKCSYLNRTPLNSNSFFQYAISTIKSLIKY